MERQLEAAVRAAGGTFTVRDVPDLRRGAALGALVGKGMGMGRGGGMAAGPLGRVLPGAIPSRRQVLIAFISAPAAVAFVNKVGDALVEYVKGRASQETIITAGDVTVRLRGSHSVREAEAAFQAAAEVAARKK